MLCSGAAARRGSISPWSRGPSTLSRRCARTLHVCPKNQDPRNYKISTGAALKEKYLPKLHNGDYIGCFGLTEPDHGSDPSSMTTKAVLNRDHYVLNGSKTWISNAPIADVFVIWAKLDNEVRGFVLDRSMDGISTPKIDGKLSLRTSVTGMIILENVKVPKINMLCVRGMKGPFSCLNSARLGISFGAPVVAAVAPQYQNVCRSPGG